MLGCSCLAVLGNIQVVDLRRKDEAYRRNVPYIHWPRGTTSKLHAMAKSHQMSYAHRRFEESCLGIRGWELVQHPIPKFIVQN